MNMTITPVNEMTIEKFCAHMKARTNHFEIKIDAMTSLLASCTNYSFDELENMDLSDYKKLEKAYSDVATNHYEDLLKQKAIDSYKEKYKVQFLNNGEIYLKLSEKKFIERILQTKNETEIERANVMYDNMHLIAAIIFREEGTEWKSSKFNEEKIRELGEKLRTEMSIKYLFPYNKILFDKTFNNR